MANKNIVRMPKSMVKSKVHTVSSEFAKLSKGKSAKVEPIENKNEIEKALAKIAKKKKATKRRK